MKVEFTTPDGLEVKAEVRLGEVFRKPQSSMVCRRGAEQAGRALTKALREKLRVQGWTPGAPGTKEKQADFAKTERGKLRAKEAKEQEKRRSEAAAEAAEPAVEGELPGAGGPGPGDEPVGAPSEAETPTPY